MNPFEKTQWTRTLEPFGITIHCRRVAVCKVKRMRYGTGLQTHAVAGAVLEWVEGAPKMFTRYLLVCTDIRDQVRTRVHVLPESCEVTCPKCEYRLRTQRDD